MEHKKNNFILYYHHLGNNSNENLYLSQNGTMNQLKLPKFSQILHTTAFHHKDKNTNNTNKQHKLYHLRQEIE